MISPKETFLERHIENFIGGKLKGISYDQEYLSSKISDNFIDFYIGFFQTYYLIMVIAILVYGIGLMVRIHMVGNSKFNLTAHMIKTFAITIFFFAFPFLFNFIITICNLMADQIMPMDNGDKFYKIMFGLDSYFNELLTSESTIDAVEGQSEKKTGIISAIKQAGSKAKAVAVETKTFVGQIGWSPVLWLKTVSTGGAAIFAWISYTSLIIVRFMGLSLLFVLAPILVPLSLFGIWGGELFDKYIKTIINLSFWIVIKSALDRVVYEYMVGFNESSFYDGLSYMSMVLSYSALVLTIPYISSYFIGGLNLSPTVAGAAWLQATTKGLFKKAGIGAFNYGKEKGLEGLGYAKDSLLMKDKVVSDGINTKTIKVPRFKFGGKK